MHKVIETLFEIANDRKHLQMSIFKRWYMQTTMVHYQLVIFRIYLVKKKWSQKMCTACYTLYKKEGNRAMHNLVIKKETKEI